MWDATMVNAIASDLYRGISDKNAWDAAAAKYFGKATTRSTTIYGRANKRAANFGTLSSDGVTAKVNAAISGVQIWTKPKQPRHHLEINQDYLRAVCR